MVKKYILISLISFLSAMAGMVVYYHYFNPVKKIYVEQEKKALQAAHHSILFSENLNKTFRSATPSNFIDAANRSRDAVVFIKALKEHDDPSYNNSFHAASGSGVIISKDGYIVTNNHVVDEANEVEVLLNDNKEFSAVIVGVDPSTDLALLKIEQNDLPFLIFGNSDSLSVGEWVMAVGNPFRLQSTVTAGIVSAKARNINILENYGIESFIQTDAAVNPGNSGGALVNTKGELVGINAAIMTYSGKYEGFSFAIPSNLARKVITDLMEFGSVQRGWLGVTINDVNSDMAEELNITDVEGVYIDGITANGGADEGGLKKGDVMIEVNGIKTSSMPEFMEQIARYRPGDKVIIKYIRDNNTDLAEVILRNQLNSTDYISVRKDKILQDLGFELRDLDSSEKVRLGNGIYVVSIDINSTIGNTNMDPGYIITHCNSKEVTSVDILIQYLQATKDQVVLEGFYENYPGEYPYTFSMK